MRQCILSCRSFFCLPKGNDGDSSTTIATEARIAIKSEKCPSATCRRRFLFLILLIGMYVTYRSRFIPEGVAEASRIFHTRCLCYPFRDAHVKANLFSYNTVDMAGGKLIAC
jgi:hypothetical protein